jgi:hypothetical protein
VALPDDPRSLADDCERAAADCRREIAWHERAIERLQQIDMKYSARARALRAFEADGRPGHVTGAVLEAVDKAFKRQDKERQKKQRAARTAAATGITTLKLLKEGRTRVAVIDGVRVKLQGRPAIVLSVLAKAALAGPDFVSHAELTVKITERIGGLITGHNRASMLSRLLKVFEDKKIEHFIESDPRKGVRLLLRTTQDQPRALQLNPRSSSQSDGPAISRRT